MILWFLQIFLDSFYSTNDEISQKMNFQAINLKKNIGDFFLTGLEEARDMHAHISCYKLEALECEKHHVNFPPVWGVQKTACKTNCNFQPGTWSSLPLCFLSLFIAICMHATHIRPSSGTTIRSMQRRDSWHSERAIKDLAGYMQSAALSCNAKCFAIEIWVGREQELLGAARRGEARALTSTLRANRYLPWCSTRHATDQQHKHLRVSCSPARGAKLA